MNEQDVIYYTNLKDITDDGPYICVLEGKEYGDIFMFNNGLFYYYDGEGPWTADDKNKLQAFINNINNNAGYDAMCIKFYEDPDFNNYLKDIYNTFYGIDN